MKMTNAAHKTAQDAAAKLIASIARTHFHQLAERGFTELESKNSGADFFETNVDAIREALLEAYTCGFADAETAHGIDS